MKIAFITYEKQQRYAVGTQKDEDEILLNYLRGKGLDIEFAIWNDVQINWAKYNLAVIKSPWDYHDRFPEFSDWLNKMNSLGIKMLNPYDIIKWNCDKHYLGEIEDSGLPVITTGFFETNTTPGLHVYFDRYHTQKLIVKPAASAGAKNTVVVTPANVSEIQKQLNEWLKTESFIVQPFMEEILHGEISFIFLGNVYSHCVLKSPKAGDFRVQHFHGGTVTKYFPDDSYVKEAQKYLNKFANGCLYARVDCILVDNELQLMELELIEPYLFLEFHPEGYKRYYEALLNILKGPVMLIAS